MKKAVFAIGLIYSWFLQLPAQIIPKLVNNGSYVQLLVDKKPFLVMGGELGNSSASSNEYMRPIWPRLKQMILNTVVAPVY